SPIIAVVGASSLAETSSRRTASGLTVTITFSSSIIVFSPTPPHPCHRRSLLRRCPAFLLARWLVGQEWSKMQWRLKQRTDGHVPVPHRGGLWMLGRGLNADKRLELGLHRLPRCRQHRCP